MVDLILKMKEYLFTTITDYRPKYPLCDKT
jgi:hypothetical protein